MTTRDDDTLPGGWEETAAEYVLGLLPEDERQAFEARLATDAALQDEVAAWEASFAALGDAVPETPPPPQVLRRIESDLFAAPRRSLWRDLLPYAAGAVLGAAVTWAVFTAGLMTPSGPELRADLAPTEGSLALRARFDSQTGLLAVETLTAAAPDDAAPEGATLELWLIAGESAPISLGLLGADGTRLATLPAVLADRLPGATLAVSREPPGGSPTGAPTGPVLAAGTVGDA